MDLFLVKIGLLIAMMILTLCSGLTPIKVLNYLRHEAAAATSSAQHHRMSLTLCALTCFSGGVFLATSFLHLFPELQESWFSFKERYNIDIDYPVAELLACLGFFLLFLIEEVVIQAVPSFAHGGHGHSHGHGLENKHEPLPTIDTESLLVSSPQQNCYMVVPTADAPADVPNASFRPTKRTSVDTEEKPRPICASSRPSTDRHSKCDAAVSDHAVVFAEPERCETDCEKIEEDPPILMVSKPHAHSHGVRSITFIIAISTHSVIEGVALGITKNVNEAYTLFISLMVHKLIVSFSVGLQLARTHAHARRWVVISMFILSLTSPLGAVFGMVLENSMEGFYKDLLMTVLQGLTMGTFLYVTFFEVLLHERDNEHNNFVKLVAMLAGFVLIGTFRLFNEGHSHAHGPAHIDDNTVTIYP